MAYNYEWVDVEYEGTKYSVYFETDIADVEEILIADTDINVMPIMSKEMIKKFGQWAYDAYEEEQSIEMGYSGHESMEDR